MYHLLRACPKLMSAMFCITQIWMTVRVVLSAGTFAEEPTFTSTNLGGRFLDVRFERSLQLWPWSGFLALYIRVTQDGAGYQVRALTPVWRSNHQASVLQVLPLACMQCSALGLHAVRCVHCGLGVCRGCC